MLQVCHFWPHCFNTLESNYSFGYKFSSIHPNVYQCLVANGNRGFKKSNLYQTLCQNPFYGPVVLTHLATRVLCDYYYQRSLFSTPSTGLRSVLGQGGVVVWEVTFVLLVLGSALGKALSMLGMWSLFVHKRVTMLVLWESAYVYGTTLHSLPSSYHAHSDNASGCIVFGV